MAASHSGASREGGGRGRSGVFLLAPLLIAGTLALAGLGVHAEEAAATKSATTREYDLKAVFLFHFTEFVEWPATAFMSAQSPMTIGIVGEDPFGGGLDQIVANETTNGRRFQVRRFQRPEETDSCQVVFVSRSEQGRMARVLERVARPGVLTVGDSNDFAKHGGVIGFVTVRDRVRLRINLDAARAAGLTISSKLLRQAEIISRKEASR